MKRFFEFIGKTVTTIIIFLIGITVTGYVLVTLWKWFIVSTFNLVPLTTSQALGLALLIRFITYQDMGALKKTDGDESYIALLLTSLIKNLLWAGVTLLVGWIYLNWF